MPKILLQAEGQISSVSKNTYRELVIKIRLAPDEYTPQTEELLYALKEKGELLGVGLISLEEVPIEKEQVPRSKKLSKLAFFCQKYAEQQGTTEDKVKEEIYRRYAITSRSQLTDSQLEECLKHYKPLPDEYLQHF